MTYRYWLCVKWSLWHTGIDLAINGQSSVSSASVRFTAPQYLAVAGCRSHDLGHTLARAIASGLLTTHHSSLTTCHSPLVTHHLSLTTRYSPDATHQTSLTTRHSPLTTHHSSLTTRHSPRVTHHSPSLLVCIVCINNCLIVILINLCTVIFGHILINTI